MNLRRAALLGVAAGVLASGCGKEQPPDKNRVDATELETTTTVDIPVPDLDGPPAPLPPNANIPVKIECQTRAASKDSETNDTILPHITVEKDFDNQIRLVVAPDLIEVDENAPQYIKDALLTAVGVGGSVYLQPDTTAFTLKFERDNLGLNAVEIFVGQTIDGTVTADLANSLGVSAQSIGEGDSAIASVVLYSEDPGLAQTVQDQNGEIHYVEDNQKVPNGFTREGSSVRSPDLGVDSESVVVDVFDPIARVGCSAGAGQQYIIGDF